MPTIVTLSIDDLKALFASGDKPTGADFANLIESTYGRDQDLQFNPVSGDLGISSSNGTGYTTVNIGDMLDANLSFVYNSSTRQVTVTRNGVAINLGPLDGIWTVGGTKANTTKWVGINKPNPGYPLHVGGNAMVDGKLTIVGDLFADNDLQIDNGLRFGGHSEQVDRITNNISVASNDDSALTTEQAVIAFVKKHSLRHIALVDLVPQTYASGNLQIQIINPISGNAAVYDSSYIFVNHSFLVPAGAEGQFRIDAFIKVHGGGNQVRFSQIWLRVLRGAATLDYPLVSLRSDTNVDFGTGAYELKLFAGDTLSLWMGNTSPSNNLSGRLSIKRLPDPIV